MSSVFDAIWAIVSALAVLATPKSDCTRGSLMTATNTASSIGPTTCNTVFTVCNELFPLGDSEKMGVVLLRHSRHCVRQLILILY